MFLIFLAMSFSALSMCSMGYLSMNSELGPWIAPIFVVVFMVLLIPFLARRLTQELILCIIASGSAGGMIGMCLGYTFPSLYFLHKHFLDNLLLDYKVFLLMIVWLVLTASAGSFALSALLRSHLIYEKKLDFPISHLIYKFIHIHTNFFMYKVMLLGVGLSSLWNVFMLMVKSVAQIYYVQFHALPMMLSVGLMAGNIILVPVSLGLVSRLVVIDGLHQYFEQSISAHEFLIIFCCGMMLTAFLYALVELYRSNTLHAILKSDKVKKILHRKKIIWGAVIIVAGIVGLLTYFDFSMSVQIYACIMLLCMSIFMTHMIGIIGNVEIVTYSWFIVLPIIYFLSSSSVNILFLTIFSTICLGLVVDFIFAHKLAQLFKISHSRVIFYQALGCATAAVTAAVFFWWYFEQKDLTVVAQKAREFDDLIKFGFFDHKILLMGMAYALFVKMFIPELLTVIGAILLTPLISLQLALAGVVAHFFSKKENVYPLWFGVYVGHCLWIIALALIAL